MIANNEAIKLLGADVPAIAGGESMPLLGRTDRGKASAGVIDAAHVPPGASPRLDDLFTAMAVQLWPSQPFSFLFCPSRPGSMQMCLIRELGT